MDTAAQPTRPQAGSADGLFVISLDFELHWGVRDLWPVAEYRENLLGVWDVVPRTLKMFEEHGIRATWATVGFLMARDRAELLAHLPSVRPTYADPLLDPYPELDAVGTDERDDPYHYAPSLVGLIANTPGQEVATHTFSHYYALEPEISDAAFGADLDAALALARRHGLALTSIVFPRNQVTAAAVRICRERGLTAFRGTESARYRRPRVGMPGPLHHRGLRLIDAYVPLGTHHLVRPSAAGGIVNVPATRYLRPWSASRSAIEPLRLSRIRNAMSSAARTGRMFHLWWHPHDFGARPDENLRFLEQVLDHYDTLHEEHGFRSASMRDVAEEQLA